MKIKNRVQSLLPTLPELMQRAEKVMAQFREAGGMGNSQVGRGIRLGFLMVEAQTGLTFAEIALDARRDMAKVRRNTENARRAYDTVLRFTDRVELTPSENAELTAMVEKLHLQLQVLEKRT